MKFKKHISILVALVVLMTNVSSNFIVHYCNDVIASISFNVTSEDPCSKPVVSCCAIDNEHDSCCSNKIVKVEKKNDNFLTKSLKFDLNDVVLSNISSIEFVNEIVLFSSNENPAFYCESNAPPLYKLYCQLVFYA
jgi:hypothetical protein